VNLFDLDTPALVFDLDKVEANVVEMAGVARDAGVRLRPHTKTHKIPELARMQVAAGAAGITCAKVGEAEVMVEAGVDDVLIAYPIWGSSKVDRLAALRERARIVVSLDSLEVAQGLSRLGVHGVGPLEVYVEVDTGHHRMGRAPGAPTADLVRQIADVAGLRVIGLLTHAGHAYAARSLDERDAVIQREVDDLVATQELCAGFGVELREISVGSTPSARREARHAGQGITEIRPGTYIFNDTAMVDLGVATYDDCAAFVLATVVSRPDQARFVIDAGTKCFTSDGFGRPDWIKVAGWDDLSMSFTTEEHGVGRIDQSAGGQLEIGDKLLLIPSHVCPVFNLFDSAYAFRGEDVVDELLVKGRGKVR
jgi:D-serine deaminase-like pyridoxal phosphate-dependent protein